MAFHSFLFCSKVGGSNTYAELWPDRIDEVAAVMEAKYQQWETQRRE